MKERQLRRTLRDNGALALCLLPLPLVPFMLAGAVRNLTGVRLEPAFLLVLLLALGVGALLRSQRLRLSFAGTFQASRAEGPFMVLGLLALAWTFSLLYNPAFSWLPTFFGSDGGSHIGYREQFVTTAPDTYAGFVSLYATMHLLELFLPLRPDGSLAITFYATAFTVSVGPVVVATQALGGARFSRASKVGGFLVFALGWALALKEIVLPLLSNMQIDGFYAHFFSVLPLVVLWWVDVFFQPAPTKLLMLGAALALLRFTYGLNLPDALVAVGILVLADAMSIQRPRLAKGAAVAMGAALLVASALGYRALLPIFPLGGYVQPLRFFQFAVGSLGLGATMAALALVDRVFGPSWAGLPQWRGTSALVSAIRLPLVLAVVSAMALDRILRVTVSETYYPIKYLQVPLCFAAAGACVSAAYATSVVLSKGTSLVLRLLTIAGLAGLAAFAVDVATELDILRDELVERTSAPPFHRLRPLVEPEVWHQIQAVLTAKHASFGGLVSTDHPVAHFLNTSLGHEGPAQVFEPPVLRPGYCAFWVRHDDDPVYTWTPSRLAVESVRESLEADPAKVCDVIPAAWTFAERRLCHRCY